MAACGFATSERNRDGTEQVSARWPQNRDGVNIDRRKVHKLSPGLIVLRTREESCRLWS